jgi:pantothenate kinase-related protein Tda10
MTPEPAAVQEARKVADAIFRLSEQDIEGYEWRLQEAARLIATYAAAQRDAGVKQLRAWLEREGYSPGTVETILRALTASV